MKVLIVGEGSYIGESFVRFINTEKLATDIIENIKNDNIDKLVNDIVGADLVSARARENNNDMAQPNAHQNHMLCGRTQGPPLQRTNTNTEQCGSMYGPGNDYMSNKSFTVHTVDSYDEWQTTDFTQYDSILMIAGIAHNPKADKALYYAVNRDLAIAVARKAKSGGVGQFIYVSTMAVYGKTRGEITVKTIPNPHPVDHYGLSKYQAEEALKNIYPTGLCIVRPPIVYGFACPGNFSKLVKLARRMPIFPDISNKRSMIYITNLCAFFAYAIENGLQGVHLPQNIEHVNTTALVREINKKTLTTRLFNPLIHVMRRFIVPLDKLFGNLYYAHDPLEEAYNIVGFEESIQKSLYQNHQNLLNAPKISSK